MAFWTNASAEPKRNFRFKVIIDGWDQNNIVWWAKTVTTPAFDVSEVEHHFYDNKFYYPGRVNWTEVTLTLVDPITPDAVGLTNQLLTKSGYNIAKDKAAANKKKTISKKEATEAGFKGLKIIVVNAEGDEVEKWTLNNPFIKSAKFGDLDYSNDELRTVELTIRYDWASCVISGPASEGDGKGEYFTNESPSQ